jgi:molybdopterin molybdotransferase
MALLSVDAAMALLLADVQPMPGEPVALLDARHRVLAEPIIANRTQPPFDVSAMDGYACRAADVAKVAAAHPVRLKLIGESAAGKRFTGHVDAGTAVRIFTGAPVPDGADAIVIQENTTRDPNAPQTVLVSDGSPEAAHIRRAGGAGAKLLDSGRRLSAREITLAASMGHATVNVRRRPRVAIIATGNELVLPGVACGPDQIVCSNSYGVAFMATGAGADVTFLGIAGDTRAELNSKIDAAAGADIIVTIGGASVGDHDLVAPVLAARGMTPAFWKIAMRPGKPLLFGRLGSAAGDQRVLGLPGNPVSALICARVFLVPLIERLTGLATAASPPRLVPSAVPLEANGPRTHYMRAVIGPNGQGDDVVTPLAQPGQLAAVGAQSGELPAGPRGRRAAIAAGRAGAHITAGFLMRDAAVAAVVAGKEQSACR